MELSIVVPVYDGECFIEKCFQNIVDQNLKDYEVIFVDNNSKDQSLKLLEILACKYDCVRVTTEVTQGAGAARNKGLSLARGKFIVFFDIDDHYYDNSINVLLQNLKANPEVASSFGNLTKGETPKKDNNCGEVILTVKDFPDQGIQWFQDFTSLIGPPGFVHRTEIIKKLGGFPTEIKIGEDAAFHINLALSYRLIHCDVDVYHYCRHSESTVSKNNKLFSYDETYFKQYVSFYYPKVVLENKMLPLKPILIRKMVIIVAKFIRGKKNIKSRYLEYNKYKKYLIGLDVNFFVKSVLYLIILWNRDRFVKTLMVRTLKNFYRCK